MIQNNWGKIGKVERLVGIQIDRKCCLSIGLPRCWLAGASGEVVGDSGLGKRLPRARFERGKALTSCAALLECDYFGSDALVECVYLMRGALEYAYFVRGSFGTHGWRLGFGVL